MYQLTYDYKVLTSDKNQLKFTTSLQLCSLALHIAQSILILISFFPLFFILTDFICRVIKDFMIQGGDFVKVSFKTCFRGHVRSVLFLHFTHTHMNSSFS